MAWRPYENLIEGELDNTTLGRVTGWLRFVGMEETVKLDLKGDFHRDIRGAKLRLRNASPADSHQSGSMGEVREGSYMRGFSPIQTGDAGDITAGLPPHDYGTCPYIEWYSEENGRVVLELEPEQVEVVGKPIPWQESEPVSRAKQQGNMSRFLTGLCRDAARLNAERGASTAGPSERMAKEKEDGT